MGYDITRTEFGCTLQFFGGIKAGEMRFWLFEVVKFLHQNQFEKFHVLADMREAEPLSSEAVEILKLGKWVFHLAGMTRSSVLLPVSHIVEDSIISAARQIDIDRGERRLYGSEPDVMTKALRWVYEGKV
jgi:hypothetical protein